MKKRGSDQEEEHLFYSTEPCRFCHKTGKHFFQNCTCDDFEDEEHWCEHCGKTWYIEGPDS